MVCIKEIALTKDTDDEFALIKWLGTRYWGKGMKVLQCSLVWSDEDWDREKCSKGERLSPIS